MSAVRTNLAVLGALLALAGCTVGPDYHRPDTTVPAAFKEAPAGWKLAAPANGADRGAWWRVYDDPLLDELVPQVAVSNQNLKAYEAAYREAEAVVREARSSLFPTVTASPSVERARSNDIIATSRAVEGSASWDLDL